MLGLDLSPELPTLIFIFFFQKDLPEIPELDVAIDDDVQLVELGVIFSIVESVGKNISYVRLPNQISIPA